MSYVSVPIPQDECNYVSKRYIKKLKNKKVYKAKDTS